MRIPDPCANCALGDCLNCLGGECSCFCPPEVKAIADGQRLGLRAAVAKNRRAVGIEPQKPAGDCARCCLYETVATIEHGVITCVVCALEVAGDAEVTP